MFRIGEFSRLTQVSVRMLRYYDETGLLKPAETDKFTNYRLYSTEQIPVLNKIIFLRDLGFEVSEITAALKSWNNESVTALLEQKKFSILDTIQSEQKKLDKIEMAKVDIRKEKIELHCNISVKSVPSYDVLSLRRVVSDYYAEGMMWKEMSSYAVDHGISVSENTFSIYHDPDYREREVDIEICAPLTHRHQAAAFAAISRGADGFTLRSTEAVPVMACTAVSGSFENIAGAYRAFAGWLEEHNRYKMGGHSRQIVHRGPWNEQDPDKYLTELQIPLEKSDFSVLTLT